MKVDKKPYERPEIRLNVYFRDFYNGVKMNSMWGPPWQQPWSQVPIPPRIQSDVEYAIRNPHKVLPNE